jgi:DNA-directed RNA polymerase specialized sigma24 family protein
MGPVEPVLGSIERVYRDRGTDFLRLALAQTGDLETARDAVQEGFARAIRQRASFRGAGSIEAWLARCVVNAAHDARERRERASSRDQPADVTDGQSLPMLTDGATHSACFRSGRAVIRNCFPVRDHRAIAVSKRRSRRGVLIFARARETE